MDITDSYPRDVELALEHYDTLGDEYSNPHYPTGWANAGNTPFQWYKQWTYEGGVHDPLIIRYPGVISDPGSVRTQFNHVSDITPTVLDILGFKKPEYIKGVHQREFEGKSFISTLKDKDAAETKTVQHFEMQGNRSIYKDGWKAVTNHMFSETYDDDVWELYHVAEDYSEAVNVADKYPEKLKELQEEWLIQASKYNVFPMLEKGLLAHRDSLKEYHKVIHLPAKQLVYEDIIYPYVINNDPGIGTRDSVITITLNRKESDGDGVLLSKGDRFAGSSIYIKDGKLKYVYNLDADTFYIAESKEKLPEGKLEIRLAFIVIGDEKADVKIYVNKDLVAETKIGLFYYTTGAGAETAIRKNPHTSVYDKDYQAPFEYKGEINKVVIDVPETNVSALEILEKDLFHD